MQNLLVVYFSKKAIQELKNIKNDLSISDDSLKKSNLSSNRIIKSARFKSFFVDIDGDWAQLNEPQDIARFILRTKAQTLSNLKKVIKHSRIEDQISFSVKDWKK